MAWPMTEADWTLVLRTAAVAALHGAAVTGLWRSWCMRGSREAAVWLAASSGLWLAALIGWAGVAGVEFGVLYWLGGTAIGAWVAVAADAAPAAAESTRNAVFQMHCWSVADWLHGGQRLLVSGPLALLVSLVVCLLAARWLPGDPANRWVLAAFLLPLLWSVLLLWALLARRVWPVACWLSGTGLIGGAALLGMGR